jgi:hypothetical protein
MARREDIRPGNFGWNADDVVGSLEELYGYVRGKADKAIDWYLKSKGPKKRRAIWLRAIAIVLVCIAGAIPIISQMDMADGDQIVAPGWASLALILAGMLVGLDRLLGYSSAWIRYISTELRLQGLVDEFQIEWQFEKSKWKDAGPDEKQIQLLFEKAEKFVKDVNELIIEETNVWVAEFQSALKKLDELAKMRGEDGKK